MTIEQAMQVAIRHHQAGQLPQAEALYRQVLAQQPDHAQALNLLGVVAHQSGRHDLAVDLIGRAIALKPDWPEAFSNRGEAFRSSGRLDEAIASHRRAVALGPGLARAHYNLGVALKDRGLLGEAIDAYRQAIALEPSLPRAHNNLGNALKDQGELDEAIAAFRQAIALKPDYAEAHANLGLALRNRGLFDEAIDACRRAIALNPDFPEAFTNLGNALRDRGLLGEAIDAYRRAIALRPDFAEAHMNLGVALKDDGRRDEAIAASRRAVELRPGDAETHYNFALALLSMGELPEGWKEHEWRWRLKDFPSIPWNYSQPQWDGSDLAGHTILLHCEQGFGDNIQFIRYVPLVAGRGGRVVLGGYPHLRRLFRSVAGVAQWVTTGEPLPPFDVHCPLMSLPLAFGTTMRTIPASGPYLHAEPEEVLRWRERLVRDGHGDGLKVGLVWAGRPTHKNDRNRSITLTILEPLARVQGVRFFSLQKGDRAIQAKEPPRGMDLIDYSAELDDFADTAALIANLDLVISVDSAVAHLAGALGQPVWVLAPFMTDWRWFLGREDSPWYPTMRLFRQRAGNRWDEVVERLAESLNPLARSRSTG